MDGQAGKPMRIWYRSFAYAKASEGALGDFLGGTATAATPAA